VVILCNFTKSTRCVDKNKFILGQLYRVENLQMANEKVKKKSDVLSTTNHISEKIQRHDSNVQLTNSQWAVIVILSWCAL